MRTLIPEMCILILGMCILIPEMRTEEVSMQLAAEKGRGEKAWDWKEEFWGIFATVAGAWHARLCRQRRDAPAGPGTHIRPPLAPRRVALAAASLGRSPLGFLFRFVRLRDIWVRGGASSAAPFGCGGWAISASECAGARLGSIS